MNVERFYHFLLSAQLNCEHLRIKLPEYGSATPGQPFEQKDIDSGLYRQNSQREQRSLLLIGAGIVLSLDMVS